MKLNTTCSGVLTLAVASSLWLSAAYAGGSHDNGHGHARKTEVNIGMVGDPAKVARTIHIDMFDNYYEPKSLDIEESETVRFVVTNKGEFVHEFNIATAEMHLSHQDEMMAMMESGMLEADKIRHDLMNHAEGGMSHDHANSALLEPGQSAELVWTFNTHAKLEFACNVPGHYGAGMMGKIKLSH
jgi:uncharacterized cupredoxin-like copper-binding protein